jgi:predicted amidohydrolase YtcJ
VPGADLLVTGRIATLAGTHGPGWVEALAIRDGRVVAAGTRGEAEAALGAGARILALAPEEVVVPGLTDSHLHLADAAIARLRVDLEPPTSIEELVALVREAAGRTPGDDWVEGAGWDADRMGRWPTADDLERAAPGRRVSLWAHDHHALVASHAALAAGRVTRSTPDPDGGAIRRDADGEPTGVLHEVAARLVSGIVPPPTGLALEAALPPLIDELVSLGVVAAHDPGSLSERPGFEGPFEAYRALAARGALGLRLHACVRPEQLDAAIAAGLRSGEPMGEDPLGRLTVGWLKTFADGSLGSRTAAMLAPIERHPGEPEPVKGGYGIWFETPEALREQVERAAAGGITTMIHGIGDAAVRAALDALAPSVGRTALMPRVEHAQLLDPADLPRFAALGIAASMQPVQLRADVDKARFLWGDRADAWTYPVGGLAASGAVIPFGTDAPVEPVDPWPGVACAVTRAAPSWPEGTPPLGPQHAIDLWRAIRGACLDPAISAAEGDRGRLVAGHRADLVVLPAAAIGEPVEVGGALWHARPRLVLMDGEVVAGA